MVKFSPGELSEDEGSPKLAKQCHNRDSGHNKGRSPKRPRISESEASSPCPFKVVNATNNNTPNDNDSKHVNMLLDPDVLECNICMESLTIPVFQCSNGHVACSACCVKMNYRCHSCSKSIGKMRCLFAEKVVESMKVFCKFHTYGCKQLLKYPQREAHETSCMYAPYKCLVPGCDFSGSANRFSSHFSSNHDSPVIKFRSEAWFSVKLNKEDQYCILDGQDVVFLLQNQIAPLGNHVFITGIGPSTLLEQYTYQLEIKKGWRRLTMESIPQILSSVQPNQDFLVVPVELYQEDECLTFEISFRHRL